MINFINGTVISCVNNTVILECGGIGYEISSTSGVVSMAVPASQIRIYTYLVLHDNTPVLYGFANNDERELFLKLITVGGIGAKLATTILSQLSIRELSLAIVSGDTARLCRIKGLGKKTAERIVLELREKINAYAIEITESASVNELKLAEATLTALGISRLEAIDLVGRVAEAGDNAEQIILKALKQTS